MHERCGVVHSGVSLHCNLELNLYFGLLTLASLTSDSGSADSLITKTKKSKKPKKLLPKVIRIIIGAVVGGFVLSIILCFVCIILCSRSRKSRGEVKSLDAEAEAEASTPPGFTGPTNVSVPYGERATSNSDEKVAEKVESNSTPYQPHP